MNIVILGLSITSGLRNGHASTVCRLVRELSKKDHQVLFLEREAVNQAIRRDQPDTGYCKFERYTSIDDLKQCFTEQVREADMVIVSSYLQEGTLIGEWVINTTAGIKAFYDLDTPVTLAKLELEDHEYLHPDQICKYELYLSSSGGPILDMLEQKYGSPMARPLYCSFDTDMYYPDQQEIKWDLGYIGDFNNYRQPSLEMLMLDAARAWPGGRFAVAGKLYPESIAWPQNTSYIQHMPPTEQRLFYNSQRFTKNITGTSKNGLGYTPCLRLFEAAACCTPIISDYWEGLEHFFEPGTEILVSYSAGDTLMYLREICNSERKSIGFHAHKKVMTHHTAAHRVQELESYVQELMTLSGTEESSDVLETA